MKSTSKALIVLTLAGLLVILSITVLAEMLVSQQIYGDWRCAFAECRIIIEKDPNR